MCVSWFLVAVFSQTLRCEQLRFSLAGVVLACTRVKLLAHVSFANLSL